MSTLDPNPPAPADEVEDPSGRGTGRQPKAGGVGEPVAEPPAVGTVATGRPAAMAAPAATARWSIASGAGRSGSSAPPAVGASNDGGGMAPGVRRISIAKLGTTDAKTPG
jgi:hypothetical protein